MTIQIISKKTKNLNDKEISIMKNARINEYGKIHPSPEPR